MVGKGGWGSWTITLDVFKSTNMITKDVQARSWTITLDVFKYRKFIEHIFYVGSWTITLDVFKLIISIKVTRYIMLNNNIGCI